MAAIRNETFYSLSELNVRIWALCDEINGRTMRVYNKTRRALFEEIEKSELKPLPSQRFEWAQWKRAKVHIGYHVAFDGHNYCDVCALLPADRSDSPTKGRLGDFTSTTFDVVRVTWQPVPWSVIKSWGSSATRKLFETGKTKMRGLDRASALNRLAALHAAQRLSDISPLKSVGLHPLKGNRKGQWAMTINGPWRLCFRFDDGNALEVEIVDYH